MIKEHVTVSSLNNPSQRFGGLATTHHLEELKVARNEGPNVIDTSLRHKKCPKNSSITIPSTNTLSRVKTQTIPIQSENVNVKGLCDIGRITHHFRLLLVAAARTRSWMCQLQHITSTHTPYISLHSIRVSTLL